MAPIGYLFIGLFVGALLQRIIHKEDLMRQAAAIRSQLDIAREKHENEIEDTRNLWLKITANAYNTGVKDTQQEQAINS